jgi:hypothetical protein
MPNSRVGVHDAVRHSLETRYRARRFFFSQQKRCWLGPATKPPPEHLVSRRAAKISGAMMSHTERMRVLGVADDGRVKRLRRVDRGSGDVDAEKMDSNKREPDGDVSSTGRLSGSPQGCRRATRFFVRSAAAPATAAPTSGSSETEQSAGVS